MLALLLSASLIALLWLLALTIDGLGMVARRLLPVPKAPALSLRVVRREQVDDTLLTVTLAPVTRRRLPSFRAGQHLTLQVPSGQATRPLQRAYSLSAWQARPRHYELGIKREPGGAASGWLWEHLRPGCIIRSSPPQGTFVVPPARSMLVLIGAGIGITPMRAMLHEALSQGRPVHLFHAARTQVQLLYRAELERLASSHSQFTYHPCLSQPDEAWLGACGRWDASKILQRVGVVSTEADFRICASVGMMDAIRQGLIAQGVPEAQIRQEAFSAGPNTDRQSHDVVIYPTGQSVQFLGQPSLLHALEQAGQPIDSDCRHGTCGACKVICLSGSLRQVIEPTVTLQPGEALACCCVPTSNVQLRLPQAC